MAKSGRSPGGKQGSSAHGKGPYGALVGGNTVFAGVDQGIDFTGRGPVFALGDGVVTRLMRSGSGWPGEGGLLVYKLTSGSRAGSHIYNAEDIRPNAGMKVGDKLTQGQQIALASGSGRAPGIECGFADAGGHAIAHAPSSGPQPAGFAFQKFVRGLPTATGGGGPTTQGAPSGTPTTTTTTTVIPGTGLAAAFSTFLELPGIFDQARSEMLVGNKSLMNDSPLLPFVEQLCHASLRAFQSMPNGNFFAFFPDYFGGLSHRTAYWEIDDIEVLDGQIELSDDALATHVYIVGDTSPSFGTIDITDEILSSGVVTIFDAFSSDFISGLSATPDTPPPTPKNPPPAGTFQGGISKIVDKTNALAFLTKYGARPYREEAPMVRNAYFELFLAYQKFMLLWSQQFLTTFTFTFMPELYPGGIVAFPDHGIQCYISDVTHECDYENGFLTRANLMAPAAISGSDKKNVHDGLVRDFTLGNDLPLDPFAVTTKPK